MAEYPYTTVQLINEIIEVKNRTLPKKRYKNLRHFLRRNGTPITYIKEICSICNVSETLNSIMATLDFKVL